MDQFIINLVYKFDGYGILLYILITTVVTCILSFCLGFVRHLQGDPVGSNKIYVLFAVGCSLLMTISIWAIRIADGSIAIDGSAAATATPGVNYDTSRIAAGVITGLGFLGAGVIFKDKFGIRGLTNAATLWICTAIGLACGSGFVLEAIVATVIVAIILVLLNIVVKKMNDRAPNLMIESKSGYPILESINEYTTNNGILLRGITVTECNMEKTVVKIVFNLKTNRNLITYLANHFSNIEGIKVIDNDNQ